MLSMTWRLEKEFKFEASHQLPHHHGKCQRLHGHSWVGRLVCEGDKLHATGSEQGMLVDYGEMKNAIQPLVEKHLDHWHLNESLPHANPTSEEIARWIFDRVKPRLPQLTAVIIEETCTSRCEYRP
jgi:6-pyruvoyltetrahydropterin/6-carboxytetrahydropterin synthase